MSFVESLNKLMKENGTSNVALGKAIGVSDMAVLRWRKGEAVPSLDRPYLPWIVLLLWQGSTI